MGFFTGTILDHIFKNLNLDLKFNQDFNSLFLESSAPYACLFIYVLKYRTDAGIIIPPFFYPKFSQN